MGLLVDTSVFVALERGQTGPAFDSDEQVALCSATASELLHGVHRADASQRREKRRAFVESILARFEVLPIDLPTARIHAQLWADLRSQGQSIGAHDLLIAATAAHHELKILTANVRDFARVPGLMVESFGTR